MESLGTRLEHLHKPLNTSRGRYTSTGHGHGLTALISI